MSLKSNSYFSKQHDAIVISFWQNEIVFQKFEGDCLEFKDILDCDTAGNREILNFIAKITVEFLSYEDTNHSESWYWIKLTCTLRFQEV